MMRFFGWIWVLGFASALGGAVAQTFSFPTANRALLEADGESRFFVGTAGRPWTSGEFGCVRSGGRQFHEGLDIRCLQRDRAGEPTDPVKATAAGSVAYINSRSGLSNYGNYVVLRHYVDGLETYSLYAHLSSIRTGLKVGDKVRAGDHIGILGRTANTQQAITKDRAHLHFEINLVVSDRYAGWHKAHLKGIRNDHGNFNGRNLIGLNPETLFREQVRLGDRFSFAAYVRSIPVMARVAVRASSLMWAKRYPQLLEKNPLVERDGIAGYELGLAFNGLPVRVIPRSAAELAGVAKVKLLDVDARELAKNPCGKLVFKRGQLWSLLPRGEELIDLLKY